MYFSLAIIDVENLQFDIIFISFVFSSSFFVSKIQRLSFQLHRFF